MKNINKITVLLAGKKDLLNKKVVKDFTTKYLPKDASLIFFHEIFFIKLYCQKGLKNKIFRGLNAFHIFNLIPFQRFKLIYLSNLMFKKIVAWIKIQCLTLREETIVIFAEFNWYSYLKRFNPKIYLLCPNLRLLISNKQVEAVELIRKIAIQAKAVFTRTNKETKEMKIFSKKVVRKSWSR